VTIAADYCPSCRSLGYAHNRIPNRTASRATTAKIEGEAANVLV
jgi:hypothetical protein